MIGAYIATRMLSLALRRADGKEHIVTQVCAAITLAVALFICWDLLKSGAQLPQLSQLP